jgi:adenosylcobinamide-phosphate synthase
VTLALAMVLDAIFGEPRWLWDRLPHPAVLMGRAVDAADRHLNSGDNRLAKGLFAIAGLVALALALGWLLSRLWLVEVVVAAILLAQRSLAQHVGAVADALRLSVGDGRLAVAQIVGRDTAAMDGSDVARAAIESAAENLSDGVIAPVFWFVVAGLPGLVACKMVNTADSMIGHRTPRHKEFGWAAARLDDVLNLIPARLTALLIAVAARAPHALPVIWRDASLHRSPNAGWPEAAMAASLGVALAGPRSYHGERRDYPFVNAEGRHDIGADQIDAAVHLLWRTWGLALGLVVLLWVAA